MSVVATVEIWSGRDGDDSIEGERNYSRVFRVTCDNVSDDAATVLNWSLIPAKGATFPSDAQAYCQKRKAAQEGFSPLVWIVTCSYSNKRQARSNPLNDPAIITMETTQFQKPFLKDKNGNMPLNSAGDPHSNVPSVDDSRGKIVIKKNVFPVPNYFLSFRDKRNSSAFTVRGLTVPAGKAKCQSVSISDTKERDDIRYYEVTIEIHVADTEDDDAWKVPLLDAGFRYKDGSERKMILNDDKTQPVEPVPLDGSGNVLANPSLSNMVYNAHEPYGEKDFNQFPMV